MNHPLRRQSLIEQTAAHLRKGFQSGRWTGQLPGVLLLTDELRVSKDVVRSALKVLEEEGWIEDCGAGRRRRIVEAPSRKSSRRLLRIGVIPNLPLDEEDGPTFKLLLGIRRTIETSGHICIFGKRGLAELDDNLSKLSQVVKASDADAWIVSGASRAVLEWFAAWPTPVYALGGHFLGLPLAWSASNMALAVESAVSALVGHGHRRIVILAQTVLRRPRPIPSFEKFLSLLQGHGIATTDYHLPHFEETTVGLENCLTSLFHITPPTALLVTKSVYYTALISFLARRGLQVPRDVSVICVHPDSAFRMCLPSIACFEMPVDEHIASITRWLNSVASGRPAQNQVLFDATYVPGGTIGPVKR